MKKIKVAVIGIGNMGQHHARVYSQLKGVELVAVADVNPKKGREIAAKYHCDYFKDYQKMLAEKEIEALSVAVPTSSHHQIALKLIEAKKHLLIEKPMASSVQEAQELVRQAKKVGVRLAVGHIERFNPVIIRLKKMISTGRKLGKIVTLIARRVGLFPSQIKDADVLVDLAVHDIDIFSYLLSEEPNRFLAISGRALAKDRDDHSEILLDYPSGTVGLIQVNWITPVKIRSLSVTGTKGHAELDYINQKLRFYSSNYETTFDDFGDFIVKFGKPDVMDMKIKFQEPLKLELKAFTQAIRQGKKPSVDGEIGLRALQNIFKVMEAVKKGNKRGE